MAGQQEQPGAQQPGVGQPRGGGGGMVWVTLGMIPPDCPGGLEWLLGVDTLFVKQAVNLLEVLVGWQEANKYDVFNIYGQRVYLALEKSDTCERQCCGPRRGFEIALMDAVGKEGFYLSRPFVYQCCGALCCLHKVSVRGGPGAGNAPYGSVRQIRGCNWSKFEILDPDGTRILTIDGPCCICGIDDVFILKSADGQKPLGRIAKRWTGLVKELFTDADNFGISFPMDLEVRAKACVLAACFLIDFVHFEKSNNQN